VQEENLNIWGFYSSYQMEFPEFCIIFPSSTIEDYLEDMCEEFSGTTQQFLAD